MSGGVALSQFGISGGVALSQFGISSASHCFCSVGALRRKLTFISADGLNVYSLSLLPCMVSTWSSARMMLTNTSCCSLFTREPSPRPIFRPFPRRLRRRQLWTVQIVWGSISLGHHCSSRDSGGDIKLPPLCLPTLVSYFARAASKFKHFRSATSDVVALWCLFSQTSSLFRLIA